MKKLTKAVAILSLVTISLMADDICYEQPYVENSSLNIPCKDVLDIKNDICKNAPSSTECSQWTSNWINKCENNEISIEWNIGIIHYNKTMSCSNILNNLFASWIPFNIRTSFRDACNNHSVAISFPRNVVPIKALKNIEDVTVSYAIHGFAISSPLSSIGIDDKIKTKQKDSPDNGDFVYKADTESSFDPVGLISVQGMGFFNHGVEYNLGDFNKGDVHKTWTQELPLITMINHLFSNSMFYADYIKNGKHYHINLNPCSSVPEINIKDAFLPSPKVDTNMSFEVDINGNLDTSTLNSIPESVRGQFNTNYIKNYGHKFLDPLSNIYYYIFSKEPIPVNPTNFSYIHFKTADGTAKEGIDYKKENGILVVENLIKKVVINILIKANAEPGYFYVILDNAYGANIGDGTAIGTILYRSDIKKQASRFWAGVGINDGQNDVEKRATDLNVTKDDSAKKQLYNKISW